MRITYISLLPMRDHEVEKFERPPLALGYLAAYCMKYRGDGDTHKVFHPSEFRKSSTSEIAEKVLNSSPELIAISIYVWNRAESANLIQEIRTRDSRVTIVIGGPEVAFSAQQSLIQLNADWCCTGEGEVPFLALVERLSSNRNNSQSIPGMVCNENSSVRMSNQAKLVSTLDSIPSPYLDHVLNLEGSEWIDLETTRGCLFNCSFCLYGKGNSQLRHFDIDRTVQELHLAKNKGVKYSYLLDPTLNLPKKRCISFMELISKEGLNSHISFFGEVRAEAIDHAVAEALALGNVSHVEVGLQSTNPQTLRNIDRSINVVKFLEGCELLTQHGIAVNIGIIIGLPGDSRESILEAIDFLLDRTRGEISAYRLQLLPGSKLRAEAQSYGLMFDQEAPYYVTSTPLLSNSELKELEVEVGEILDRNNDLALKNEIQPKNKKSEYKKQSKKAKEYTFGKKINQKKNSKNSKAA